MVFDVADKVVATAFGGDSLFALSLLALPYLPWIADWVPARRLASCALTTS